MCGGARARHQEGRAHGFPLCATCTRLGARFELAKRRQANRPRGIIRRAWRCDVLGGDEAEQQLVGNGNNQGAQYTSSRGKRGRGVAPPPPSHHHHRSLHGRTASAEGESEAVTSTTRHRTQSRILCLLETRTRTGTRTRTRTRRGGGVDDGQSLRRKEDKGRHHGDRSTLHNAVPRASRLTARR